jgi:glycosyltransferase involved in cell wall biosynthesis
MSGNRLGLSWQLGSFSGWGVYGTQILLHAAARYGVQPVPFCDTANVERMPLFEGVLADAREAQAEMARFLAERGDRSLRCAFPVLHALGNDLAGGPVSDVVHGDPDLALVFLEEAVLDSQAVARSRRFRRIVAGSSWNGEVLRAAGLDNVEVCIQGVDLTVFHPAPRSGLLADRFVVFSGGKLEYRKGQDIVIEAFRRFHARHPEALLVASWFNPWPGLIGQMAASPWTRGVPHVDSENRLHLSDWLRANGLPDGSFRVLGALPNSTMATVMREADAAVFPNRCEGGTNLVAMECLACGVPTILSANTGHLDLLDAVPCYPLQDQGLVAADPALRGTEAWGESSVDELVDRLESIHQDRERARETGEAAAETMGRFSWTNQIGRLFGLLGLTPPVTP